MKSARLSRVPSLHVAVLVRVVAFLATIVSVVLIPTVVASAAAGHESVARAFATSGVAVALTLATVLAARSIDPLRR